jgi:hypothetical protein
VSTKLDANDISSTSTSEVNAINLSLEVDAVNLLVLLVFFYFLIFVQHPLNWTLMTYYHLPHLGWTLLIYHQRPLWLDVVDLLVLFIYLFICTSPLASTKVDVDNFKICFKFFIVI